MNEESRLNRAVRRYHDSEKRLEERIEGLQQRKGIAVEAVREWAERERKRRILPEYHLILRDYARNKSNLN